MNRKKYSLFCKGDVIRTNPEKGFYGIAVVLDDGKKIELSPGRWSYPLCHIAITPLLYQFEVNIEDIDISTLKPMTFLTYHKREDDKRILWREKICVDIYTTRNKVNLPVIGNIDTTSIYESPLSFEVSENGFHACGDVNDSLGREAYINWCRESALIEDKNMVLLVVDTQKLITTPALYNFDIFRSNVKKLMKAARENRIEVIYVRHDDGAGQELTRGRDGFEIYEEFEPGKEEKIFDKCVNSPFKDTGLLEYLTKKHIKQVIVVGLQTDYCIDATVKCGFEHGFHMIIPEGTNSTFDNEYMPAETTYRYYNDFLWKGRYADCITMEETLVMMER